ncbi:zinc ribbon domain-containing protein [Runella limosa]|uniref:zinc ribbon domain-containing protein n=1 Tax=Runella limosa TaxID=370978 RepID=UPI00048DEFEF|nr:zinc ribbon domain-containing protein [Runella limosa]
MYCIQCGAKIPDNSKFCSHCGHKQTEGEPSLKEKLADVIIEKEITRQVIEAHKSSIEYQFIKKAIGWYLAWVFLHLGLLLTTADSILGKGTYLWKDNDNFWPISKRSVVQNYDIREFLVYTIFPLAILFIRNMLRTQKKSENSETKSE